MAMPPRRPRCSSARSTGPERAASREYPGSRSSPSRTASRWAAASAWPGHARAPGRHGALAAWRCPRRGSASRRTWAAPWLLARALRARLGVHLGLHSVRTMDAARMRCYAGFAVPRRPPRAHLRTGWREALADARGPRQPRRARAALRRDARSVGARPRPRLGRRLLLRADRRRDHHTPAGLRRGATGCDVGLVPGAAARPRCIRLRRRRRRTRDALADRAHRHPRVGATGPHAGQP